VERALDQHKSRSPTRQLRRASAGRRAVFISSHYVSRGCAGWLAIRWSVRRYAATTLLFGSPTPPIARVEQQHTLEAGFRGPWRNTTQPSVWRAAALAARAHRERRNSQRKGNVGVGSEPSPLLGFSGPKWRSTASKVSSSGEIGGELRGGPVRPINSNGKGQQATLVAWIAPWPAALQWVHGVLDGAMQRDLQPAPNCFRAGGAENQS